MWCVSAFNYEDHTHAQLILLNFQNNMNNLKKRDTISECDKIFDLLFKTGYKSHENA